MLFAWALRQKSVARASFRKSLSVALCIALVSAVRTQHFANSASEGEWLACPKCCDMVATVMGSYKDMYSSVVCFALHERGPHTYTFVTDFSEGHSYYLKVAQRFLSEVSTVVMQPGYVVWRVEDNASLNLDTIMSLIALDRVVVFGHSVFPEIRPYIILAPNFHFIDTNGFRELSHTLQRQAPSFQRRVKKVFWRGSTTGQPCNMHTLNCSKTCDNLERVRFVRTVKAMAVFDVCLSGTVQWCNADADRLLNEGMLCNAAREQKWVSHVGLLDIDGNVDAWGLHWRLKSGSAVFKVKSKFVNLYSEAILPGVHVVELSGEMSGLQMEQIVKHALRDTASLEIMAKSARDLIDTKFDYDRILISLSKELLVAWNRG